MLKRSSYSLSITHKIIDILIISMAWWFSYLLRFKSFIPASQQHLGFDFLTLTPLLLIVSSYSLYKNGLYSSMRFVSQGREIGSLIKANTFAIIMFVILLYFFAPARTSRMTLIIYFILSNSLLVTSRLVLRKLLRDIRSKGKNLRHVLFYGDGPQLEQYLEKIRKHKDAGINVAGWLDSNGLAQKHNILAQEDHLEEFFQRTGADLIIVGHSASNASRTSEFLKIAHKLIIDIKILPDLSHSLVGYNLSDFDGIPVISINEPKISTPEMFLKRGIDILGAGLGILILSPILLLIALAVKLSSKGPIFYGQERMGLDGKNFKMWKFRSMKVDAEDQSGAVWAVKDDPRRTSIGTFLRSTSLDEFPQLWNVLVGEMSLVGPRPERPVFVEQFKDEIPAYMLRHKMKAGVTGWAQVNGWRGDTSLEKRIECDIYYIKNWSIFLDIKILFMTIWSGFVNKNAY